MTQIDRLGRCPHYHYSDGTTSEADHSQQQLHYDGAHRLIAVRSSQIQGNAGQLRHHSRYTYDALGRRLKQQEATRHLRYSREPRTAAQCPGRIGRTG
ncbi:hypothetical protein A9976_29645 [Delftia sp. UME58]|nr:hypothetical protein [Delftia sp. UME58]